MEGYWGGILEAKVVMAAHELLVVLGQGTVWLLMGLWVI